MGSTPFGASPGLGERQTWLQGLLLGCLHLSSIFVEENGGSTVYNGVHSVQ